MFQGDIIVSILGGGALGLVYSYLFLWHHMRSFKSGQPASAIASVLFSFLRLGFLGASVILLVAYCNASFFYTSASFLALFWSCTFLVARKSA